MKKSTGITTGVVIALAVAIWLVLFPAGDQQQGEVVEMNVAAEKQECVGVGPRECLVVNDELFYANIDGFEFESGNEYTLRVRKTEKENVPADASSFNYELVEVVDQQQVSTTSSSTPSEMASSSDVQKLQSTNWQWKETQYSNGDMVTPQDADAFVLSFEGERFGATTDCNNLMGQYSAGESSISFSQIASTLKACAGETQEGDFKEMLSQSQGYLFTEAGNLALTLEVDSGSVIFTPVAKNTEGQ